jgi:photosystem II stability/assembly factor-like uncharacterized protein
MRVARIGLRMESANTPAKSRIDLMNTKAYAASVGHSVWFSQDHGEKWARAHTHLGGIYNESRCWCVSTHPAQPGVVLSGTDQGIYRWDPVENKWIHLPSELDSLQVLQLEQAPWDPDFILAGTRPAGVYRSIDAGQTWSRLALGNAVECSFINTPRVTSIHFDPRDRDTLWVTIEIDAIWRSRDRGATWERLGNGLLTDDVHTVALIDELGGRRILVATEEGLHRSDDEGRNFYPVPVPQAPWPYFRAMVARADRTGVLFLAIGDRPSGETGMLLRSRDWGETWADAGLPKPVNSTIWSIGTNVADPLLIYCCTIFGQVFRSSDGGENWTKLVRELGELRMITWAPTGPER